jgi:invasion protein IalB
VLHATELKGASSCTCGFPKFDHHFSEGAGLRRSGSEASAICLAISLGLYAEDPACATPSIPRFEDWELICGRSTSVGSPSCRISQQLAQKEKDQTLFALTVSPSGPNQSLVGIASIPLGGYLVPGIELRVDNRKAYRLLVETCTSAGCHAGFPLEGRVLKELQSGQKARFRIWTDKTKPVDLDVSLNGFGKALAALREGLR